MPAGSRVMGKRKQSCNQLQPDQAERMGATGRRNAGNRPPPITSLLASHVLNACDTPIHPSPPVGWFSVGQRHRAHDGDSNNPSRFRGADITGSMSTEADPKTRFFSSRFWRGYTRLQIFQGQYHRGYALCRLSQVGIAEKSSSIDPASAGIFSPTAR